MRFRAEYAARRTCFALPKQSETIIWSLSCELRLHVSERLCQHGRLVGLPVCAMPQLWLSSFGIIRVQGARLVASQLL